MTVAANYSTEARRETMGIGEQLLATLDGVVADQGVLL